MTSLLANNRPTCGRQGKAREGAGADPFFVFRRTVLGSPVMQDPDPTSLLSSFLCDDFLSLALTPVTPTGRDEPASGHTGGDADLDQPFRPQHLLLPRQRQGYVTGMSATVPSSPVACHRLPTVRHKQLWWTSMGPAHMSDSRY